MKGQQAERTAEQSNRFPRPPLRPAGQKETDPEVMLEDIAVWDLMTAFAALVEQTKLREPRRIVRDDVPVAACIEEALELLRRRGGTAEFIEFFPPGATRPRIIAIFLALLELIRQRRIEPHESAGAPERLRITLLEAPGG